METRSHEVLLPERAFRRGAPGYEGARRATMWNARLPDRYPDLIVQARDVYDVVRAVKVARREGMRVGVRSGGHSWAGNHVRDGGLLLDVSALKDVTVDELGKEAVKGGLKKVVIKPAAAEQARFVFEGGVIQWHAYFGGSSTGYIYADQMKKTIEAAL